MSSIELDSSVSFVTGGVVPGTFVVLGPGDVGHLVIDDPEIDSLDLASLSAQEQEEEWGPNFYGNKLEEDIAMCRVANKERPTLVMVTGRYRFDADGVPMYGARLACSKCSLRETFPSMAALESNLPEECGAEKPLAVCPLYSGQMKRQYDRRNK